MRGIMNCIAIIAAATLLSFALGWQLGVGIALLVWFHKAIDPNA
jgi:ABC-type proline/glycine betaine transport system permease subunit